MGILSITAVSNPILPPTEEKEDSPQHLFRWPKRQDTENTEGKSKRKVRKATQRRNYKETRLGIAFYITTSDIHDHPISAISVENPFLCD